MSINNEKLQEKLGEALGLEMAAQKAVNELISRGLIEEETFRQKIENMKGQAGKHEDKLEELVDRLSKSEGLDPTEIQSKAQETEQKASRIMETYLGQDPDTQEALEFLCLAEGGEVSHYEVLSAMARGVKDKQFGTKVKSILEEEKRHLKMCTTLARQNIAKEA
jgi:ferritin-like metal-binding protein YciE